MLLKNTKESNQYILGKVDGEIKSYDFTDFFNPKISDYKQKMIDDLETLLKQLKDEWEMIITWSSSIMNLKTESNEFILPVLKSLTLLKERYFMCEWCISPNLSLAPLSGNTITYQVYNKYVVQPTDTRCTSQLTDGRKELTLITCTNGGKQRLVVKLRQV